MKIATIGTGFIVDKFLNAIKSTPGVQSVAMFSRTQDNAVHLANKYNIHRIYTDLDTMLIDEKFDFVYIASPNSLHYEHAVRSLMHGKNVICEKPFTSTAKETAELITLAKQKHLMLFEAISTIHLPNYRLIKEIVPQLGKIKMIQANYSQYSSRYDRLKAGETPNIFNPAFSGGALMDLNVYNIHFVVNYFGAPQKISYMANKHPNGIDTSGILLMEYPDFLAECVACKDTNGLNFVLIQGENGYIHIENGANKCNKLNVITSGNSIVINKQFKHNLLSYELNRFRDIYTQQNFAECQTLLTHSHSVMNVLETARKDAGIVFGAD